MATTVRSSSTNAAASGTAVSVSAPSGTGTGDVVIVTIHCNGNTTIVDNNGATPFTEDLNDYQPNAAGQTLSVFSRRIQAGDPSTYNFTIGASDRWTIHAVTFQNPHPTVIYDVAPTQGNANNSSVTSGTSVSITTLTNNAIHCAVYCVDGSSSTISGTPAGYTVEKNSGNQVMAFVDKVITSPAATGTQTFTHTSQTYMACSFAIRDIENKISFTNLGATTTPDFNTTATQASYASSSWTPPTSGLILLFVHSDRAAGDVTAPTVTGNGLTWTLIASLNGVGTSQGQFLFAANASGSSTGATTIDYGGNNQANCSTSFFLATGTDVANGVAQTFVQTATSTPTGTTSPTITLSAATNAANRAIAYFYNNGGEAVTPRTNWTELDDWGGSSRALETQYRLDAFETTASATSSTNRNWFNIAAELKAAVDMVKMRGYVVAQSGKRASYY